MEDFVAVRSQQLKASIGIPCIGQIAQVIRDAMIEQRDKRANRHSCEQSGRRALDGIRCFLHVHPRHTAIGHLRDDCRVHQQQRGSPVTAHNCKSRPIRGLAVDDVRDGILDVNFYDEVRTVLCADSPGVEGR